MTDQYQVLDHTALLALGEGRRQLSELVTGNAYAVERHVYAPAVCVVAAGVQRPALIGHLGALPALEILELTYGQVEAMSRVIRAGLSWPHAHAAVCATATMEHPGGIGLITTDADTYRDLNLRIIPIL